MIFENTGIHNAKIIKPQVFNDNRGFFLESYSKNIFNNAGISDEFVQDNLSFSRKNVIRGMHGQINPGQAKLVRCIKGKIIDCAIDIRPNSPTFLQKIEIELSDENQFSLFIPHGCLHGFSVLSESATVLYKVSGIYNKENEYSVNPLSCDLDWGILGNPIISERDKNTPSLQEFLSSSRFLEEIEPTFNT